MKKEGLLSNYKKVLGEVEKQILVLKKRKPNNNHSLRERAKYANNIRRNIHLIESGKGKVIVNEEKKFRKEMMVEMQTLTKERNGIDILIGERKHLIACVNKNIEALEN